MKIRVETQTPVTVKADLLVINLNNGRVTDCPAAKALDEKMGGHLSQLLKKEKFEGKVGQTKLIPTLGQLTQSYVLVVGLGDAKKRDLEAVRKASGSLARLACSLRLESIVVTVLGGDGDKFSPADWAQALVEGLFLSLYSFNKYKPKPKDSSEIKEVIICTQASQLKAVKEGVLRGEALSQGVSLARDLINTTAQDLPPLKLAEAAKNLKGVKTTVHLLPQIKKLKMGAYLGVAKGSVNPPAFIEMHYVPAGAKSKRKKLALIGKGVTFDSGGYSLKPAKSMETMKDDMSGAAAVIGFMSIVSELKPNIEISAYVAAAENMIDATAQRPGDVVTAMNGKTIEVLNTDAEGRLTLADAITYANKKKPDYMIDIATLTGACLVALGDRYSAILGNDKTLIEKIIKAGQKSGEMIWELPLAEEYKDELKSPIADLKNVGGPYGGTINGALFIGEFVGDSKWAHLDIAGPSWTDKPREYELRGGTGVMVRTLAALVDELG